MSLIARVNQKGNLFSSSTRVSQDAAGDYETTETTSDTRGRRDESSSGTYQNPKCNEKEEDCEKDHHHHHHHHHQSSNQKNEGFADDAALLVVVGDEDHHHHGKECRCYTHPPVDNSLVQSLEEVAFDNGIWSIINKNLTTDRVREFLARNNHTKSGNNYCVKKCPSGYSPLLYAAKHNNLETVALLIENGADVKTEVTPETKMSALHRAACVGNYGICCFLLQKGGNEIKHMKDSNGLTAYDWIAQRKFQSKNLDEQTREDLLKLLAP